MGHPNDGNVKCHNCQMRWSKLDLRIDIRAWNLSHETILLGD